MEIFIIVCYNKGKSYRCICSEVCTDGFQPDFPPFSKGKCRGIPKTLKGTIQNHV